MPIKVFFKSHLKNASLVKSEIHWLSEPKWLNRLILYFLIFLLIYIAFNSIFSYFGFLHTDVDSARYMLSALVQSEAAIVAIVVTLSLVAVQLAASSYSARVIEVFRKTPDLWILIGTYGFAIFWGLGVLKLIEKASPENSLSNLESYISFAYYFGIFVFVALIPYTLNTLNLLKPSTVIKRLSERITKQNILAAIGEEQERTGEKDPIQPIIDIVRGSLMKHDYETTRDGLSAIGNCADHIFKNESFKGKEEEKISRHIFSHFTRIGKLAASRGDGDSTLEVIINLHKNGIAAAKQKLGKAASLAVEALGRVGKTTAEQKLEYATEKVTEFLQGVGIAAAKQELEDVAKQASFFLGEVGKVALEQKLKSASGQAVFSFGGLEQQQQSKNSKMQLCKQYFRSKGLE